MTTETVDPPRTVKLKPQIEMPKSIRVRPDTYTDIYERYVPKVLLASIPANRRVELGYENVDEDFIGHPDNDCDAARENAQNQRTRLLGERRDELSDDAPEDDFDVAPVQIRCPHTAPQFAPDPDVIYVGRFLDGLVAAGIFENRALAKTLLNNIPAGRSFKQSGIAGRFTGGGSVEMWFKPATPRVEMIETAEAGEFDKTITDMILRDGKTPAISMGTIIKNAEPGEIRNSPDVVDITPSADEEVDLWKAGRTASTFDARIILDKRYGMHYLKRGDEIELRTMGWPSPASPEMHRKWVLRPLGEGPSVVEQERVRDDVIQLSNMRA